jgi:excisionase family DNA binding protein
MTLLTVVSSRRRDLQAQPGNCRRRARGVQHEHSGGFTALMDARAASRLLGVPHTWLLAQARAGRVPHHRLGHYVRFNPQDLASWLQETRIGPPARDRRLAR